MLTKIKSLKSVINLLSVVKAAANHNGLYADFSPKPLDDESGNGMHINMSVKSDNGADYTDRFMAGVLAHAKEMTAFLNPVADSYKRFGKKKAPKYITWSTENRSQLIRIPAAKGEYKRIELRSPDPTANPYIAFSLLIYAGLDGINSNLPLPDAVNQNLYTADRQMLDKLDSLPSTLDEAIALASSSRFITDVFGKNASDFLGL